MQRNCTFGVFSVDDVDFPDEKALLQSQLALAVRMIAADRDGCHAHADSLAAARFAQNQEAVEQQSSPLRYPTPVAAHFAQHVLWNTNKYTH